MIHFVTSWTQNDPKWSKNHLKCQRSIYDDCVGLRMRIGENFWDGKPIGMSKLWHFDFLKGKTTLWRQIWRQISWNSQKCHSNDVRMPTNDRIELKTCMDTYFHPRNAMVVSEYLYFDLMKAKTILWHQIWRQISSGNPKVHWNVRMLAND